MNATEPLPAVDFGPWIETESLDAHSLPQKYMTVLLRTRDCSMQTGFRVPAYSTDDKGEPYVSGHYWLRTGDLQIVTPTHVAQITHLSGMRVPDDAKGGAS